MDIKLNKTRDYEKKSYWTFGENKPKQSQYRIGRQMAEDSLSGVALAKTERQMTELDEP